MKKMERVLVLKTVIIHLSLVPFYIFAQNEISKIPKESLDTLVLFVGLIVIAPITVNFIYTYRRVQKKQALWLGHITTFFLMLVIGMLFVALDILLMQMIGQVWSFRLAILLFWLGVISFDFADFWAEKE